MTTTGRLLEGRIGIVTGASAGIGRAIAGAMAREGCAVLVNARREAILREVVAEIESSGGKAAACAGDCSDQSVIDRMLDEAQRAFGRAADLVVVNAGRGLAGSVVTSDTAQWEEMIRTNYLGAALLMRAAAQRMLVSVEKTGWLERARDIVVIGSVVGRHVSPFSSMYGSTKFAVHGLAEGLRREVGPKGIRVTLVEPGFVRSEFQGVAGYEKAWFDGVLERIGPVLEGEDVARAVVGAVGMPPHVHVSDMLIRPTRQEYP